ncbi:MAG TPA: hypothetical protein VIH64_14730 [Streptosporangiaceae bacterium]
MDGAEAGRADAGAGAEAGAAATLTGLGAGVVAPWVPVEPTAWTVELTAWVTLDGAAATDDSGEEPVAPEPDVAGATRVECPVDVELADGVAVDELAETEAAADVTALAGVELAGALWDWLDDAGADCDAAGREAAVEAEVGAEPFAEPECPAEPALPVEPEPSVEPWPSVEPEPPAEDPPPAELPVEDPPLAEPEPPAGAVDWADVEWAEAAESPCESAEPTGLAWDDVLWTTAEATEPTVCRALAGPEAPAAEDGDDGVVSAWACWCEKSTSRIRIPAASNPACTARRAMPRRTAWATRVLPTLGVASTELPFHHACPFMQEELDLFDIKRRAGSHGSINQGITAWPAETQMISTRAAEAVTVFRLLMRSFWDW